MTTFSNRSRHAPVVLGAAVIMVAVLAGSAGAARNVLILIADDVGADKIAAYVDHYNSNAAGDDDVPALDTPCAPIIDSLAASGVLFSNAWGCPTCSPTRASILTGTHPFRHGVYTPEDTLFRPPDVTTIAEVLGVSGYTTAVFGKWHLGSDRSGDVPVKFGPIDHGWDRHVGYIGGGIDHYDDWDMVVSDSTAPSVDTWSAVTGYSTRVLADSAVAWIRRQTEPWLAWVAFNAAHTPLDVPPPPGCGCFVDHPSFDPGDEDDVFRATIECMDEKIGSLLERIPRAVIENTTIIFMGDNGTPEGRSALFPTGHNKGSLFEGGVNIPLIIADGYTYRNHAPSSPASGTGRVVNPGRIDSSLVQEVDLFDTIADIAGGDASTGLDGVTLIPLLEQTATSVRTTCFEQLSLASWAVRGDSFKLIRSSMTYSLYPLGSDRWESSPMPAMPILEELLEAKALAICPALITD